MNLFRSLREGMIVEFVYKFAPQYSSIDGREIHE